MTNKPIRTYFAIAMNNWRFIYTPGISSRHNSISTRSPRDIENSLRQTAKNETTSTGTWQGPFQYGGHFGYQTDPDSNLELLGHRYYDSSIARFLSRDPIKDGRNWYSYAGNNPLSNADPNGLAIVELRYRRLSTDWIDGALMAILPIPSLTMRPYHAYVVVIDEVTGRQWAISGGPASHDPNYGIRRPDYDPIQIFAGSFKQPGYTHYDEQGDNPSSHPRVRLVDDDLPAQTWIDKLSGAGRPMREQQVPYSRLGPNSNTTARELLRRVGITPPADHPVIVPGWNTRWPSAIPLGTGGGRSW